MSVKLFRKTFYFVVKGMLELGHTRSLLEKFWPSFHFRAELSALGGCNVPGNVVSRLMSENVS